VTVTNIQQNIVKRSEIF